MRSLVLLLVLPFAWVLLVPASASSQTTNGDPSGAGDQYDQGSTLGDRAVHDAIKASGAIQATSEEAQATETNTVSAAELPRSSSELDAAFAEASGNYEISAEAQSESASISEAQGEGASTAESQGESASATDMQGESANTSDPKKLPDTGGPSLLWLGVPLACIGGLFARRLFLTYSGFHTE